MNPDPGFSAFTNHTQEQITQYNELRDSFMEQVITSVTPDKPKTTITTNTKNTCSYYISNLFTRCTKFNLL